MPVFFFVLQTLMIIHQGLFFALPGGLFVLPDGPGLRSLFLSCRTGPASAAGPRQVQCTCTIGKFSLLTQIRISHCLG